MSNLCYLYPHQSTVKLSVACPLKKTESFPSCCPPEAVNCTQPHSISTTLSKSSLCWLPVSAVTFWRYGEGAGRLSQKPSMSPPLTTVAINITAKLFYFLSLVCRSTHRGPPRGFWLHHGPWTQPLAAVGPQTQTMPRGSQDHGHQYGFRL